MSTFNINKKKKKQSNTNNFNRFTFPKLKPFNTFFAYEEEYLNAF